MSSSVPQQMKAVLFQADLSNTNLSDTLMDRAVINEANLRCVAIPLQCCGLQRPSTQ